MSDHPGLIFVAVALACVYISERPMGAVCLAGLGVCLAGLGVGAYLLVLVVHTLWRMT